MKSWCIERSSNEQLLGVTVESKFIFEKHLNELCRKGNQNLHALRNILAL